MSEPAVLYEVKDYIGTLTLNRPENRNSMTNDVLEGLGHVAEGVPTAECAHRLAERLGVELPISSEVYRVLFEGKPVGDAVRDVLQRPLKREG